MPIACDFAMWYFLHGSVDGVEPPFSLFSARHVPFQAALEAVIVVIQSWYTDEGGLTSAGHFKLRLMERQELQRYSLHGSDCSA